MEGGPESLLAAIVACSGVRSQGTVCAEGSHVGSGSWFFDGVAGQVPRDAAAVKGLQALHPSAIMVQHAVVLSSPIAESLESEPHTADAVGRYEIQDKIATGGMGSVFRAIDRSSGQAVALKRATAGAGARPELTKSLEREYQVLASLEHPRIIRVLDYGIDVDGPYYAMELLAGEDLRALAPLRWRRACSYLRDVATSLALLHGRKILHRDLSPGNVRLTTDGHCKLLDFGALTDFGPAREIVGTPPMIAPEALSGAALDQRADLYALGALAYYMLTGKHVYPARDIASLRELWEAPIIPPSQYAADVPVAMDALILALLRQDPLARPSSAAEVIARLEVVAELRPEEHEQEERLAQAFLASPRFIGRKPALDQLHLALKDAGQGRGDVILLESEPGMGRTRLLKELQISARIAGATVLWADAGEDQQPHSTLRALVLGLYEQLPGLARQQARDFAPALRRLGSDVLNAYGLQSARAPSEAQLRDAAAPQRDIAQMFAEVSRRKTLVLLIDDGEQVDDASLGFLATLASVAREHSILMVISRSDHAQKDSLGHMALKRYARSLPLAGLDEAEMRKLVRSIFGGGPNRERFADWLRQRSAGRPLHAIEICRRLLGSGKIQYSAGLWTLPNELHDSEIPVALIDTLALRLNALSEPARALAECLSLQRGQPNRELCDLLCDGQHGVRVDALLHELLREDVILADSRGYRFTSSALRDALIHGMEGRWGTREANHRRLGEALFRLAGDADQAMQIEAGFHLIQGDEDLRGAQIIAVVAADYYSVRMFSANLIRLGPFIEAALQAFRRHRRSPYERMPLLGALAQVGYYESRELADRYGDEALDVLEDLSGLRTARRLRPWLGKTLGLTFGMLAAYVRFLWTPRGQRPYGFWGIIANLCSTVTTLTGVAALSLDRPRAERVAATLEPFTGLPARLTPVGIAEFCTGLAEITRERPAEAFRIFERLRSRFENPRYYPTLPEDGRNLYLAGIHFARAALGLFRPRGTATLESADALDRTGLRLYAMIASQLRALYYCARGEVSLAEPHRMQVELHAAHMGSVWQVETWEAAMMTLIQGVCMGDVLGTTQIARRLAELSKTVPSLRRYTRLAVEALAMVHADQRLFREIVDHHARDEPRSYIGWAATISGMVRGYNQAGDYAEAKRLGEHTLAQIPEEDREMVLLCLEVEREVARADASLGDVEAALARIDGLLTRFEGCAHPLLLGLLHESRAVICWDARRAEEFAYSWQEVERWFRPTGTPVLIAKCERLAGLAASARAEHQERVHVAFEEDDIETIARTNTKPG
ncbi:MAG: protein kinase [Myxococcales bacterium]|nr:protein kinase [Myxococcales bacterium]